MNSKGDKIWFPAKTYGFGWGLPVCWQGWAVLGVFLVLLVVGSIFLLSDELAVYFFIYAVTLSIGLLLVCWLKGETPHWRWGRNNEDRSERR
jgi:hypothetical protein